MITDEESLLLRLLTPVYKAYYAKSMIGVCAELIEAFGGQGYIEDTGIPCLMRDVQVGHFSSWWHVDGLGYLLDET
jgi:alkylation response protein AidB-like acyl-CoA dehydrogenase